ncbi:MAG: hypothetical protein GX488_07670 [Clostridiales bacterium]|nr:hypothetical protein [Clostridiales bacterium]
MLKRIVAAVLAIAAVLCIGGCSGKGSSSEKQTQKLVVFKTETDGKSAVGAYELQVNLAEHSLSLGSDTIYEIEDSSSLEPSRIFPQYMSPAFLVLRTNPLASKYDAVKVSEDNKSLYFEEYILQFDDENFTFQISKNGEILCKNVSLVQNGKQLMPVSFFVDKDGKIAILCMTAASLMDTEMVSVLYAKNGESYTPEKICEYPTVWEDYDLSKVNCPNYLASAANVAANPETGVFLYNETVKLLVVSPYDGSVECVLDEKKVTSDMPYLDAHRESYSFFNGFGYQNGYYAAAFPAFNSPAGAYAVFYTSKGEYAGCILCGAEGITLFDSENKQLDKIEGSFLPQIYVPSYFGKG